MTATKTPTPPTADDVTAALTVLAREIRKRRAELKAHEGPTPS